jgi:hypothetical protein
VILRALLSLFRRTRWTDADIEHYERMFRLEEAQRIAKEKLGTRWLAHEKSTYRWQWERRTQRTESIEFGPAPTAQPLLYLVRQAG